MVQLYQAVRLHVNYFQTSFKLREKIRDGARVIKRYSPPATPCDRVMQHDEISAGVKKELRQYRAGLDPVALLSSIREAQSAMAAMSSPQLRETPHSESIDRFLARLPSLWQQGEARPTHKARVRPPRHWRTRKDPFEGVYCEWKDRGVIVEFSTLPSRAWAMANPICRNCERSADAGAYCSSCAAGIMASALNPHFRDRRKRLHPGPDTLPRRPGPTVADTSGQQCLFG